MDDSTIHLLVGPDAGRGRAEGAASTVFDALRRSGRNPVDITADSSQDSLSAVRAALDAGADRIVVVGGDGLVHLALQAVAGTDTTLGIIAAGTGNDFARALGAPEHLDLETATSRALGAARTLDAIHTGHGWAASVVTAGFSGCVNARANRLRFPRGQRRYSVATLLELPRLEHHRMVITVDGRPTEIDVSMMAVGNTAYFGGGMHVCPAASPDDGLLDMTLIGAVGRREMLRWLPSVFRGEHLDHPAAHTMRGAEIAIEAGGLELWGDGELMGPLPVVLRAEPAALHVAV